MSLRTNNRDEGFTLIEVLAALLVFSIAIIGLTRAGSESVRAVTAIDDKMVAGVIADNQLILARQSTLKLGTQSGEVKQMSREYVYDLETVKTETPGFYRLRVSVKAKGQGHIIVARTAFRQGKI